VSDRALRIQVFNDPVYVENGMVLSFDADRPCWIIDPGLPPQAEQMLGYMATEQLRPEAIVLTHAHADHIAGIDEVRARHRELPLYLAREEWPMLVDPEQNLSARFGAGFKAGDDHVHDLSPGDELTLDGVTWMVLDTSGHSPGGRTLYAPALSLAIVGDAIFAGSIGRIDFPHSSERKLLGNIRDHILTLPDDTRLIPGHGPATTVADERATNPFLQGL
jgi:hydroxyacylglutathione hydrolase